MRWQINTLTIPVAQPDQAPAINYPLLTQYDLMSIQNIREHVLTYVIANTKDMMSLSENGQKNKE